MKKIKWLGIIRILGLLLVLVYHFFRDVLPGGFIGVDVFFTLSGYLVTISIIDEFQNSGEFSIVSFCRRRFMRLYPPLLLCMLFSLPFSLLLSPDFTVNIGRQLAAALGFVTNYFEIKNGGSYEAQMLPHLFLHTWFLAVEVHLYLLWAVFCTLITLLLKKTSRANADTDIILLRVILIAASVTGAVLSYLRMQTLYGSNLTDPSAAYFDTGSRAFPFLLGACAGCILSDSQIPFLKNGNTYSFLKRFMTICGMALMAGSLIMLAVKLDFSGEAAYRFGFAAASLLTVLMIFSILFLHSITANINEPQILTTAAVLSYNIYLFHWPLYNTFFYTSTNRVFAAAITLLISVVFSGLVFFGLEPLFRRQNPLAKTSAALRRTLYTAVPLLIMAAVTMNGFVFARAPEISSLEEQLLTGYIYQDADRIGQLQQMAKIINKEPIHLSVLSADNGNRQERPVVNQKIEPAVLPVFFNEDGILAGVTIIGDSVCNGARKKLTDSIPNCYVNAEGSRQIWQGYDLLMDLQKKQSLREYIVIALGTNQNVNSLEKIDSIIADLQPGHRLVFVTPYNAAMNENWITYKIMQYLQSLPDRYPFITVADWAALIGKQPQLLGSDKVHIGGNSSAITLYSNCIIEALNAAAIKPAK